ncbi:hypothetical protein Hanom_Chr15g01374881 [Helianthus anomalus]
MKSHMVTLQQTLQTIIFFNGNFLFIHVVYVTLHLPKCLRICGMVGRGLGAWCETWTMGHPRAKANFKGVWWGVGWVA